MQSQSQENHQNSEEKANLEKKAKVAQFAAAIDARLEFGQEAPFWRTCPLNLGADGLIPQLEKHENTFTLNLSRKIVIRREVERLKYLKSKYDGRLKAATYGSLVQEMDAKRDESVLFAHLRGLEARHSQAEVGTFFDEINKPRQMGDHAAFWRSSPLAQNPAVRKLIDEVEKREAAVLHAQQSIKGAKTEIAEARSQRLKYRRLERNARKELKQLEDTHRKNLSMVDLCQSALAEMFRETAGIAVGGAQPGASAV